MIQSRQEESYIKWRKSSKWERIRLRYVAIPLAVSKTNFIPVGVLPMMGRLHPKGVPFSGFRYMVG